MSALSRADTSAVIEPQGKASTPAPALLLLAALTLASACGDRIAGASVEVIIHVDPLDASSTDSAGVTPSRGWLTIASAQLVECASTTRRLLHALNPIGTAWAHGTELPTRLATPFVIDLMHGSTLSLGTLKPPPGTWCTLHLALAPADEDAVGVASTPMAGRTLMFETESAATAGSTNVTVGFDLSLPTIDLTEAAPHATIDLALTPKPWLAQTTIAAPELTEATAARLITNTHP